MAGTNNEDELLILSDDSDTGSDFVLNEQVISDNNSSANDMISFDTGFEDVNNNTNSFNIEENLTTTNSNDFSFSIEDSGSSLDIKEPILVESTDSSDFSFSIDPVQEKSSLSENTDSKINQSEQEFSFGDNLSQQNESSIKNNNTDLGVGTMTDIIDEAIFKFLKREDLIGEDISLRESHVNSLKNDISELEKRVNLENEEISKLNLEKQAILKNRKSLEKMKESPVTSK